jgi:hypothetical protein
MVDTHVEFPKQQSQRGTHGQPQRSTKRGLQLFVKAGVEDVQNEMEQLHDRNAVRVTQPKELTPAQKREALDYLDVPETQKMRD